MKKKSLMRKINEENSKKKEIESGYNKQKK